VDEVLPYIRAVQSRIQKREYFDMAMDALQINDISLKRELWQSLRTPANVGASPGQKVLRRTEVKPTVAEQRLLELLLANGELRRKVLPSLQKSDYEELATASIFTALIELDAQGDEPNLDNLSLKIEDDLSAQQLLPMLLMGSLQPGDEKDVDVRVAVEKCLDALRLVNIDRRIRELSTEIAAAERNGDDDRRVELIMEYGELNRRRKNYEPQSQIAHAEIR
jgi:replicative DNA helicase